MLQKNIPRGTGLPSILVLSPTKESVGNIVTHVHTHRDRSAAVVSAVGGSEKLTNISELRNGCDYLIGTPGRVLWLARERHAIIGSLSVLVLDEANLLLSSDLVVELLRDYIPAKAQRVLCSSEELDSWYDDVLRDIVIRPGCTMEKFVIDPFPLTGVIPNAQIRHYYAKVSSGEELKQIRHIVDTHKGYGKPCKAVIIPRSSAEVFLFHASPLFTGSVFVSADMSASVKAQELTKFRQSKVGVLVAYCPLAADDMRGAELVINCGVPKTVASYFASLPSGEHRPLKSVVLLKSREIDEFKKKILSKSNTGLHFTTMPLPTADDLSLAFANRFIQSVKNKDLGHVEPPPRLISLAETLLKLHGVDLFAGLLDMTERRGSVFSETSLLSGAPGYTPVLLFDPFMKKLKTHDTCQKLVRNCIRRVSKDASFTLGRIVLSEKGFVVDVPTDRVNDLVKSRHLRNIKAILVTELPRLVDNTKLFVMRRVVKDRTLLLNRKARSKIS
jgi:hypothetical protein